MIKARSSIRHPALRLIACCALLSPPYALPDEGALVDSGLAKP
jgi:hypothetical protein